MPGDDPGSGSDLQAAAADQVQERRRDPLFRSLIDEMLEQIRELRSHAGPMPVEERARVEADLERIMAQVRQAALHSRE